MANKAADYAKKHLEDVLAFFGINVEVVCRIEDDIIKLDVPSTEHNGFLIGERGQTLRALQQLLQLSLQTQDYETTRVSVDIADYKKQRAERLAEQAHDWALAVKADGEPMKLEPMNPVDRRTVHQTVNEVAGVETTSEGQGRDRHVVIQPTA